MSLWICRNCYSDTPTESGHPVVGHPFESDLPVCPKCGCDRRNPRQSSYIGEREVIHFDPPDPVLHDRGTNVAACDPAVHIGSLQNTPDGSIKPHFGTAHKSAVTCPKCRASEAFLAGAEAGSRLRAK